jgi:hypothetical protein
LISRKNRQGGRRQLQRDLLATANATIRSQHLLQFLDSQGLARIEVQEQVDNSQKVEGLPCGGQPAPFVNPHNPTTVPKASENTSSSAVSRNVP